MADNRYGNRGSSIFSDDDQDGWRRSGSGGAERWRSEQNWRTVERGGQEYRVGGSGYGHGQDSSGNRSGSSDDRGFFERAGDEVRSWFGDEEAERRREMDARRYEQEHGQTGRYRGGGHDDQWRGGAPKNDGHDPHYSRTQMRSNHGETSGYSQDDYRSGSRGQSARGQSGGYGLGSQTYGGQQYAGGSSGGQMGGYGQSSYGQSGQSYGQASQSYGQGGQGWSGSHHDESYRRWRDQQISQLDSEYEEYCRHRQQQFEQDFSTFRQSRRGAITSGGPTMSQGGAIPGTTEIASSSGAAAGTGATTGGQTAGSISTGSGSASAATASTGSSNPLAEPHGSELTSAGTGKSSRRR
jgi:hypothetical protein